MSEYPGRVEWPIEAKIGRGLEGAVAGETAIGYVDGQNGRLIYRGYSVEDLCEHSTFEEVSYLLLYGDLPTAAQLDAFKRELVRERKIPGEVIDILRKLPRSTHPMSALQVGVAALGGFDRETDIVCGPLKSPADALPSETRIAVRLIAKVATVAAVVARIRAGRRIVDPDPTLDHTANFIKMVTGEKPEPFTARVLDVSLILHADHGMNASTFSAMVVHSSLADLYGTVAAAIASLKGPLHGGANERVLNDLLAIDGPQDARRYVEACLSQRGGRVPGFGHRVYKAYDPRARVFHNYARELCRRSGKKQLLATAEAVEQEALKRLEGRNIFPNVDFYSGLVYHAMGIETSMFTVLFALARVSGWVARVLEYLPNNRIFRPRAVYTGAQSLSWKPLSER